MGCHDSLTAVLSLAAELPHRNRNSRGHTWPEGAALAAAAAGVLGADADAEYLWRLVHADCNAACPRPNRFRATVLCPHFAAGAALAPLACTGLGLKPTVPDSGTLIVAGVRRWDLARITSMGAAAREGSDGQVTIGLDSGGYASPSWTHLCVPIAWDHFTPALRDVLGHAVDQ